MKNSEIATVFFEIADILEMQGVQWKPRAYRTAAVSIQNQSEQLEETYKKGGKKALEEIPGIGKAIAKKIEEILATGKLQYLGELRKSLPLDVEALNAVPGLGPKRLMALYKKLKIKNLEQLRQAALQHKISKIAGFGEKSEALILEGLGIAEASERIPLEKALSIALPIKQRLQKNKLVLKVEIAGSIRRKKPTIRDIDILVATNNPKELMNFFVGLPEAREVIMKGPAKSSIRTIEGIQVDLRAVKQEQWGSALLYFTGSKQHNIELRKIAIKKGLKLNEYGLFKRKKIIASKKEEEIYKALGLQYLEPEKREN